MKLFILKTLLFLSIILGIFALILFSVDGYTDPIYIRFTTPMQDNLIIGTSRSAQGLKPQIIDSVLNKKLFNYSFSLAESPFGPVYFNSIKRKLNPDAKEGIYIVAVDPWSITNKGENPNDSNSFEENKLSLANTSFVNMNPNFQYLLKSLQGKYYKILTSRKGQVFLHNDGWLEVSIPMDSASINTRSQTRTEEYRKNQLPFRKLSTVRLDYLKQTVEYLKRHGKVYIVRLPVCAEMFNLEQQLIPNFNEVISPIVKESEGYLDFTTENQIYQYTDGNHVWKESANLVSKKVAEWIKMKQSTNLK